MAVTDDWTHWLFLGLLVWAGFLALVAIWWTHVVGRHSESADAELVQSHVDLVETPVDWQERHWA